MGTQCRPAHSTDNDGRGASAKRVRLAPGGNDLPSMTATSYYRTKDGLTDYQFSFEQQPDGNWRAYILTNVDYRGHADGCHETHRLRDGSRPYVCWTNPLTTESEARAVAAIWADKTQRYIRFGERF